MTNSLEAGEIERLERDHERLQQDYDKATEELGLWRDEAVKEFHLKEKAESQVTQLKAELASATTDIQELQHALEKWVGIAERFRKLNTSCVLGVDEDLDWLVV